MVVWQLPIATVSEANSREHWAVKRKRHKAQQEIILRAFSKGHDITLPCVCDLRRISPRELDDDNLVSSMKAIRDQIAECLTGKGKGRGDRDPRLKFIYSQAKGKPKSVQVTFSDGHAHVWLAA